MGFSNSFLNKNGETESLKMMWTPCYAAIVVCEELLEICPEERGLTFHLLGRCQYLSKYPFHQFPYPAYGN